VPGALYNPGETHVEQVPLDEQVTVEGLPPQRVPAGQHAVCFISRKSLGFGGAVTALLQQSDDVGGVIARNL